MFKNFCILVWELLAKDKFSKGLEWQTILNFIARAFKVATVTLLKVTGSAKIYLTFSVSEKLPVEWVSLLLIASARLGKEGTDATNTTAPEARCHFCILVLPPFLNVPSERLVEAVLQLCREFPAAFGIMMCSVNEYLHVQVSWDSPSAFSRTT